jgi:hypothetical protein
MSYAGLIADPVKAQLDLGERVLWAGQPRQGVFLRGSDVVMIPFSLMWGGFAYFWEWSVLQTSAPGFFALWGIPFVVIGTYMIFGRFFGDAWQRAKTYYAVTNERIMVVDGLYKTTVRTAALKGLNDMSLSEGGDGVGTILFGSNAAPQMFRSFNGWPGTRQRAVLQFDSVADARVIYNLIRSAQKALEK